MPGCLIPPSLMLAFDDATGRSSGVDLLPHVSSLCAYCTAQMDILREDRSVVLTLEVHGDGCHRTRPQVEATMNPLAK